MKKTALSILLGFITICGFAQGPYDALLFSENEYEGTARSMAMGNAFTALGGDLGSIGINPAGSAVAGYSQITITPGLTFSASTAKGVSPYEDGTLPYFEREMKSRITNFSLPNLGFMFNFETQRQTGLKNFTIGFVANKTAGWNEDIYANGTNSTTSFMGEMAYGATIDGMTGADLGSKTAYDYLPWKYVVGFGSGMISTFGGYDDQFVGASEIPYDNGDIALGGTLEQAYGRKVKGEKYDYLLNFGANVSDFIYFGANFGFTTIDYSYRDYFKESAVDPANFEIVLSDGNTIYFNDMRYRYDYEATGVGYYGKFGVIVTPGMGLRIGAAIQTPTLTNITEEWHQEGETTYNDRNYNASDESPWGEGSYKVVSPFRANLGLAYTIGSFGLISADYEFSDYSQMKFKSSYYDWVDFSGTNEDIKEIFRPSHSLRVGAEIKPLPELAIRAGYGLTTSPENAVYETKGASIIKTQNASLGLGYSSKDSFFADLAVRRSFLADEYVMPYSDYIDGVYSPEILIRKNLWKVALTLGWRF